MEANSQARLNDAMVENFSKLMNSVTTRGRGVKASGIGGAIVWITGKPGFGKSQASLDLKQFIDQFGAKWNYKGAVVIHLDKMLVRMNAQEAFKAGANPDKEEREFFLVDVKTLSAMAVNATSTKKLIILEGINDNADAVIEALKPFKVVSVVLSPDYKTWITAIKRRLSWDAENKGSTLQNLHIWEKFSKMSESDFRSMIKKFILLVSRRQGDWVVLKTPARTDLPITEHGYTDGSGHTWKTDGKSPSRLFFRHPKRVGDIYGTIARYEAAKEKRNGFVVLVDGAEPDDFKAFENVAKPAVVSLHAVTGVYEGKEFDNSKDPLFIKQIGKWALLEGDAKYGELLNAELSLGKHRRDKDGFLLRKTTK